MRKLLLVDDAKEIYTMVQQALGSSVELHWANSLASAQVAIDNHNFDLLLLDVELPDGNGVELCSRLQAKHPSPIVFFLTVHNSLSEKVLGFSAGADDYITKPFEIMELKARVESKLKKLEASQNATDHLKWKEIEINKNRQEVTVHTDQGSTVVELTSLEFKILAYFAHQPGNVIPRDKVLDEIWGKNIHVYPRSVDTHVSKLRKKLGPAANIIESVHGTGYKFVPTEANT